MLARDELEVDKVNGGPDFPRSLASRKKIGLDLGSNGCGRVSVDKSEVGEEDGHEKRTPHGLVDKDLFGNRSSVLSGDLGIEPVVEVVTGRSVVEKTEDRKSDESLHVEWTPSDEDLCQHITKSPSNERGACLCGQWTFVQSLVVCGPSGDSASANKSRITEERALGRRIFAEGRLDGVVIQSDGRDAFCQGRAFDTESAGASRDEEETKKLHGTIIKIIEFWMNRYYFQTLC
mmetsp:Transcript_17346/g.38011  ORF Transcript_17346/g.38011 Transcript_17346/m.38011 type:complete len:233 (+) Transcript_17346:348-1046(+)